MRGRAAGLDKWEADSLLLLPLDWWEAFTSLWRQLLDGKGVPKQWRGTYVHLLEKNESNDTRPIGLTSLGWRIGSKWLVGALRELADSWLDATVSGGVHGSSVMDTHQYITHVNNCEAVFISQDLSQFFDTISHELLSEFSFTFGCQRRRVALLQTCIWEHGGLYPSRATLTLRGFTRLVDSYRAAR